MADGRRRLRRGLARWGERLGFRADVGGLLRLLLAFAVIYALWAAAYPPRSQRPLRHVFEWVGILALLFLWARAWTGVRRVAPFRAARSIEGVRP